MKPSERFEYRSHTLTHTHTHTHILNACVPTSQFICSNSNTLELGHSAFGKMIRSWGQSPQELDNILIGDPKDIPLAFYHVRTQQESTLIFLYQSKRTKICGLIRTCVCSFVCVSLYTSQIKNWHLLLAFWQNPRYFHYHSGTRYLSSSYKL